MSILGLDIGDRRIGIALAEEGGTLAVPVGALERTTLRQDLQRLADIALERRVTLVVAGLPISINGTLGPQATKTQSFLKRIHEHTHLPIVTVDERYSSSEAGRLMQNRGAQPSRRRGEVDAAAATIILQAHLDHQSRPVEAVSPASEI